MIPKDYEGRMALLESVAVAIHNAEAEGDWRMDPVESLHDMMDPTKYKNTALAALEVMDRRCPSETSVQSAASSRAERDAQQHP